MAGRMVSRMLALDEIGSADIGACLLGLFKSAKGCARQVPNLLDFNAGLKNFGR
jgi:hypothetical protein